MDILWNDAEAILPAKEAEYLVTIEYEDGRRDVSLSEYSSSKKPVWQVEMLAGRKVVGWQKKMNPMKAETGFGGVAHDSPFPRPGQPQQPTPKTWMEQLGGLQQPTVRAFNATEPEPPARFASENLQPCSMCSTYVDPLTMTVMTTGDTHVGYCQECVMAISMHAVNAAPVDTSQIVGDVVQPQTAIAGLNPQVPQGLPEVDVLPDANQLVEREVNARNARAEVVLKEDEDVFNKWAYLDSARN